MGRPAHLLQSTLYQRQGPWRHVLSTATKKIPSKNFFACVATTCVDVCCFIRMGYASPLQDFDASVIKPIVTDTLSLARNSVAHAFGQRFLDLRRLVRTILSPLMMPLLVVQLRLKLPFVYIDHVVLNLHAGPQGGAALIQAQGAFEGIRCRPCCTCESRDSGSTW